jgi:hypothetical protein
MSTQAQCENSISILLAEGTISEQQGKSDSVVRGEGVQFTRGAILAFALCLPVWALVAWAVARLF